jgi:hypothetical protein
MDTMFGMMIAATAYFALEYVVDAIEVLVGADR